MIMDVASIGSLAWWRRGAKKFVIGIGRFPVVVGHCVGPLSCYMPKCAHSSPAGRERAQGTEYDDERRQPAVNAKLARFGYQLVLLGSKFAGFLDQPQNFDGVSFGHRSLPQCADFCGYSQ
jgi:hypothetical protein